MFHDHSKTRIQSIKEAKRVNNNQCLSFLSIGLCHTHLSASQLEGWGYNELNTNRLNADTKTKENECYYFQMLCS
jgi:hypothetical protein